MGLGPRWNRQRLTDKTQDADNESGELKSRKRVFPLFLPDVNDRSDDAGQQAHQLQVLCPRAHERCRVFACAVRIDNCSAVDIHALA